jgi:hypothetical protein
MSGERELIAWPLVQNDAGQWSIPDHVLRLAWRSLGEERARNLFYDAWEFSEEDFIETLKRADNFPVLIVETEPDTDPKIRMIGWINGLREGWAQIHFACIHRSTSHVSALPVGQSARRFSTTSMPCGVSMTSRFLGCSSGSHRMNSRARDGWLGSWALKTLVIYRGLAIYAIARYEGDGSGAISRRG